jgi:hypothetical protein
MRLVDETPRLDKFDSVQCATAAIALIAACILWHTWISLRVSEDKKAFTSYPQCGHIPSTYRSAKNLERDEMICGHRK